MPKLENNIKILRKALRLTQKELGDAIGVAANTIAMYERGDRHPNVDVLQRIASIMCVTVEQLIHEDFSDARYEFSPLTVQSVNSYLENVLPLIDSKTAIADLHFSTGYKHCIIFCNSLKDRNSPVLESCLATALDEFKLSLSQNNTIESAANILWIIFMRFLLIQDKNMNRIGQAIINGKGKDKNFVKDYILLRNNDNDAAAAKRKQIFAKQNNEQFLRMITALKASPQYSALADYYIALMYIFGLISNDNSFDINQTIGISLMSTWLELGNDYAYAFFYFVSFFSRISRIVKSISLFSC